MKRGGIYPLCRIPNAVAIEQCVERFSRGITRKAASKDARWTNSRIKDTISHLGVALFPDDTDRLRVLLEPVKKHHVSNHIVADFKLSSVTTALCFFEVVMFFLFGV